MLTKEQKMKMVSDAIDAGFIVDIRKHSVDFEELDRHIEVFDGLPVLMECGVNNETTWANINGDREFEDKFTASIFLV